MCRGGSCSRGSRKHLTFPGNKCLVGLAVFGGKAKKQFVSGKCVSLWPWYPRPSKKHLAKQPLRDPFECVCATISVCRIERFLSLLLILQSPDPRRVGVALTLGLRLRVGGSGVTRGSPPGGDPPNPGLREAMRAVIYRIWFMCGGVFQETIVGFAGCKGWRAGVAAILGANM